MTRDFAQLVEAELARARAKHGSIRGPHEALGVILEEFDELKAEIYRKVLDREATLEELVQLAAMCRKAAEDLELLDEPEPSAERRIGFPLGSETSLPAAAGSEK